MRASDISRHWNVIYKKKKTNKQAKKSVLQGFYGLVNSRKKETHPNRWKLEIIVGGGVDERGALNLKILPGG